MKKILILFHFNSKISIKSIPTTNSLKFFLHNKLFQIARSNISELFIGLSFEYFTPIIPIKKIVNTKYAIAINHPVPCYDKHFLIIPKKSIKNFMCIDFKIEHYKDMLISIFQSAQDVIKIKKIDPFTIILNGGKYQDVPQLHFHLASYNTKNRRIDILLEISNIQVKSFSDFDLNQKSNQMEFVDILARAQKRLFDLHLKDYSIELRSSDIKQSSKIIFHLSSD